LSATSTELDLLSRQINQAHRNAVDAELSARGLGEIGHPMLLTILESSGPGGPEYQCHAQAELARLLHVSPAAVANSLKSLEKGGYIHREPGRDARRNQVLLTDKGRRAVVGCRESFETVAARMLAGFTPEELDQLLVFRRRMLENLRSMRKEGA